MATSGDTNRKEAKPPLFLATTGFYAALAGIALSAGIAAGVLFAGPARDRASSPVASAKDSVSAKFIRPSSASPIGDLVFADASGQARRLSEWRGRTVILNLWATWCAPCKTEMPSLDRLQEKLAGRNVAVVALSTDRTGLKEPASFFASQGIRHLELFNDQPGEATTRLRAAGLPTTIILDGNGQEIARLVGPAEWDSPEVISQIEAMASPSGTANGRADSPAIDSGGSLTRP